MKRTVPRVEGAARAVARGELIGCAVRVAESSDRGIVGQAGVVVDETLKTLVVRRTDGRDVRYGKRSAAFDFRTGATWVRIPGAALEFRPEDRTKKVR